MHARAISWCQGNWYSTRAHNESEARRARCILIKLEKEKWKMDATHAHNFRLKPVHSNMGFIPYISSSNKTHNVDWQTSVMLLLGRKSGCCTLVPDAAKNVPGLSRRSGWKDLPCGLNPPVDIYTTLGGSMLPKVAARWGWGHWTQRSPSDPRITLGLPS